MYGLIPIETSCERYDIKLMRPAADSKSDVGIKRELMKRSEPTPASAASTYLV